MTCYLRLPNYVFCHGITPNKVGVISQFGGFDVSETTGTCLWPPETDKFPWGWNLSSNYLVEGGAWAMFYVLMSPVNYNFSKLLPSTSVNCSIYLHDRKEASHLCILQFLISNTKYSALTDSKYPSIQDMNEKAVDVTLIFLYLNQINRMKITNTNYCYKIYIQAAQPTLWNHSLIMAPGLNSHKRMRNEVLLQI